MVAIFENNFSEFSHVPKMAFVVIADVNTCSPICAGQESQAVNLFKRMLWSSPTVHT